MKGNVARVQPMPNGELPLAYSRSDLKAGSGVFHADGTATTVQVTHDYGATPTAVVPGLTIGNTYTIACTARTATTLTFTIKNSQNGAPASNLQTVTFDWFAVL
jgi:hypothetical protein